MMPIAIDCFAGAGGLSQGLQQAGFDVRAAFDVDPHAVSTYKRNIGNGILECDVAHVTGRSLLRNLGIARGRCDLVAGGPPCQGFSVQRRGPEIDERNQLIFEFLRIVDEVRPRLFLMENVAGLAAESRAPILGNFVREAEKLGYSIERSVLNAADYGVPQLRRRLFMVGRQSGTDAFSFPSPTHSREAYVTVRDAIGDLPSPTENPEAAALFANHEPDRISDLNRQRISHVPQGGGREDIPEELRLPCHRVSVEKAGHRNVFGRLSWDEPASTITTRCNSFTRGRFAHPSENRNITMREAARLQGFPDDFEFTGSKVDVAHQLGNAVPPPLARAVGAALHDFLRGLEQAA